LLANDPQVSTLNIPASGTGAGLFFVPASLDLGKVALGSPADTALALVNQTRVPLEVDLRLSRGFFSLGMQHLRLEPGARARVALRFAPDEDGDFVARLRVVGQDLEAALAGTGSPAPDLLSPPALDLGEVELGQVGRRALVLRNQGRGPLHPLALGSSHLEFGTADYLPVLIPPGGERILQLWFAPRTRGPLRPLLQLRSDDPDQPDWAVALSGQGRVGNWKPPRLKTRLEGGAEAFSFGTLAAGARAERILTLYNYGAGVLRVKRISAADAQVRAEPESLVVAPGEHRQVRVSIAVAPAGATAGILELASDDPEHPLQRWAWHYRQAAARAQLLSPSLVFGPAEAGRRLALLAVANQGETQLMVDLADTEGQLRFAADRLLVALGQVARVQVEHRGPEPRGVLRLPSNDPGQPELELPWEAADLLELVSALPAAGSTAVPRQTTLNLRFDQAPSLEGLDLTLTPAPLNTWRRSLLVQGNELQLPVELVADQTYKLVLLAARSLAGTPLAGPVELSFSTGAQPQSLGQISGRVVRAGRGLTGTALLAGSTQELVGAARLDSNGGFVLSQVPAGTYQLFAREEGSQASLSMANPCRCGPASSSAASPSKCRPPTPAATPCPWPPASSWTGPRCYRPTPPSSCRCARGRCTT